MMSRLVFVLALSRWANAEERADGLCADADECAVEDETVLIQLHQLESDISAVGLMPAEDLDESEMCPPVGCQLPAQSSSRRRTPERRELCKRIALAKGDACGYVEGHRRRRRGHSAYKDCQLINNFQLGSGFEAKQLVDNQWSDGVEVGIDQIVLDQTVPTMPEVSASDLANCGGKGVAWSSCKAKGDTNSGKFQLHNKCRYVSSSDATTLGLEDYGCYSLWKVPKLSGNCPNTLDGLSVEVDVKEWSGCQADDQT